MGLTVRQLVDSMTTYGVMPASDLAGLRDRAQAEIDNDAESLLRDLVRQNKLTKFQAANLYSGRGKGLVFGEYVILDKIGAGGMGQVYKAQHRKMKRVVALKILPPQSVGSQKAMSRFYQEVEVAAKLMHPNIVTAYDAGEANGMLYLVMEFVDGKDLSSYVSKHGPLSLEQTLNVVLQAARGLAYAHGLGIIHRDIKPSNLLVNREKVVKILDMGLARVHSPIGDTGQAAAELTASGEVMGTIDYMSPEQATDTRTADQRSDIYALGCTLYRLYVGRPPYGGETAVQKILAHRDKPIPPLREARPETPDLVERLYQKMVAKKVEERTQTMTAVVASLERLLSGVDDDRSSVMLGVEPIEDDATFLPSGVALGGSSVGGPGSSASGQSHIHKSKSAGSSIGAATSPLDAARPAAAATAAAAPFGIRTAAGDTDSGGATQRSAPAAARATAGKISLKDNRKVLIGGGAAAAVVLIVAAYFLFRGSDDPAATVAANTGAAANGPAPTAAPAAAPKPTPLAAPSAKPLPTQFGAFSSPIASATPSSTTLEPVPDATPSPSVFPLVTSTQSLFGTPATTTLPPELTPPSTGSPAAMKQEDLTAEIDLLALVDPSRGGRGGKWTRQGSEIVGPGGPGLKYLEVPFAPPEEYDLTCVAVPTRPNVTFGPGLVLGGRTCSVQANHVRLGLTFVDGYAAFDTRNPTYRQGAFFSVNAPVTIVCAVRRGRVAIVLDGKRRIETDLQPDRIAEERPDWARPGRLYLRTNDEVRFTSLKIGPPVLEMTPETSTLNLAAAFEQTNVVEGTAAGRRGEILLTSQPNAYAKVKFPGPTTDEYVVRAVVERGTAGGNLVINLPCRSRRTAAVLDFSDSRFVGLHNPGGGVDVNPTGRRGGLLLTPGELHTVVVHVRPEAEGYRFIVRVDGREWVRHATNNISWDGFHDVGDTSALGLCHWSGNLRVVRLDLLPGEGERQPVPPTGERSAAAEAVRALAAQGEAKGAPLDAKLLAVDLLRKKAATEPGNYALRYEALETAIRLAAGAGDLPGAYEAIEDLTSTFDVDPQGFDPQILETFKTPRTNTTVKQQFIEDALRLMTRAARDERYALAAAMGDAVDRLLGTTNSEIKRELKARAAEYEFAQTQLEPVREARKKIADGAADAAAHRVLGQYLGAVVGDWPTALKELSQSDDPALQAAVLLEQNDVSSGDAKFAIAEKWLELSDKEKVPPLKWAYAERAAYWYRRAAVNVSDAKRPVLVRQLGKVATLRKASNGACGQRRPTDAVKIGDHWYKLIALPMHWDAALTTCENLGGHVIVLDTPAENQAVAQYVLQQVANSGTEQAHVWLGAHDADKEGSFRRLDGLPLAAPAFLNWIGGEPNNANGDEDYICWDISLSGGQVITGWRDGHRNWGQMFVVCEWDH